MFLMDWKQLKIKDVIKFRDFRETDYRRLWKTRAAEAEILYYTTLSFPAPVLVM